MARALVTANDSENRLRVWLSTWLSSTPNLAGMDGNRTHPGRLSSAPQTVLKTAALPSRAVHGGPLEFDRAPSDSTIVQLRPPLSVELAVFLAVSRLIHRGLLIPRFRVRLPARAPRRCASSPPRRSGHAWSRDPQEARPETATR